MKRDGLRTGNGRRSTLVLDLHVANGERRRSHLPEAAWLHGYSGQLSGVLSVVDCTELVRASRIVLQVDREDGHSKLGHDRVEECHLLLGLDGVEL